MLQASRVNIIRKLVSNRWTRALRRRVDECLARMDACMLPWASGAPWRARGYYAFWSRAFDRENAAVLAGRAKYAHRHASATGCRALLRRNTHRIEKGLLMRPARPVFALDYIDETVDCYARMLGNPTDPDTSPPEELQWAHDVLSRYFDITAAHPRINPCRTRFQALSGPPAGKNEAPCLPYLRDLSPPPPIGVEALHALAVRRRSVRWFLPAPVPRELIDSAVAVASLSPSACNRQPFEFRIFDDPAWVRRVAELPFGTAGYHHNIPVLIVLIGRLGDFFDERDRHLVYIDGSLAAMAFVYAAEAQGLSTCCINWPDVADRDRALAELLHLAPDERAILCIAVGYPDPEGLVASSPKKPLDELRRYNNE